MKFRPVADNFHLSNSKLSTKKNPLNKEISTEECANNNGNQTQKEVKLTEDTANYSKRVREILLKKFSLTGVINISQVNKPVQFESSLERDYIYLLEFNSNVKFYLEQPLEIKYEDYNGKKRKYTPDFIVEYFDGKIELIEIKYKSVLISKRDELEIKFEAAKKFCKKNQFEFKVITDDYIRIEKESELINYKFLSRYKSFFKNIDLQKSAFEPYYNDFNLISKKINEIKKCTIIELVNKCANDEDKKAEIIFLTWYLIANKLIYTDFTIKLSLNSIIWVK